MNRKLRRAKQKKASNDAVSQLFSQALTLHQQGKLEPAKIKYQQILDCDPYHVSSLCNLGLVWQALGNIVEAEQCFRQCVEIKPDYANAYNSLGLLLEQEGNIQEAIEAFKQAIDIKPQALYYYNLSGPLIHQRYVEEAKVALEQCVALQPDHAKAYLKLANIYNDKRELEAAESAINHVLQLESGNAQGHYCHGNILFNQDNFVGAKQAFERVLSIDKQHTRSMLALLQLTQQTCEWENIETLKQQVIDNTKDEIRLLGPVALKPFDSIILYDDPTFNLSVAKARSEEIRKRAIHNECFSFQHHINKDLLTIGYISADFREHAFGHITQYLFGCHDKSRFRVIGYATAWEEDSVTRKRYAKDADKFVNLVGVNDVDAARQIYEDEVDILIDCTCFTAGARVEIAAQRPAPIQVNCWGFTGSTGASFFDYIIGDKIVIPEEHADYYSEKVAYLPDTLQINHPHEAIAEEPLTRKACGLPEDGFVFSCLNAAYKFEPVMFDVWMRLLLEVEGSVLWLRKPNDLAVENLRKEAKARGVAPERLVFAEKLPDRPSYFKRLQLADLGLDTRIYNGGSTTMDALWAGIPVITLLGNHYASRMSAGIIHGVNMPELITYSLEEYASLALRLAGDSKALAEVKEKLWEQRMVAPLFDTKRYVNNLEKAYEAMWKHYINNQKPKKIVVKS